MHQVALVAVKRLNLQKPVHLVVHHCITPHCVESVRTFLCCFAKQGKNMQRTAFFWLCHPLLRSWNWSERADLRSSDKNHKKMSLCSIRWSVFDCELNMEPQMLVDVQCTYLKPRFSMRNLSRISFITFSCISEVDWASQKATVATSWGQYIS